MKTMAKFILGFLTMEKCFDKNIILLCVFLLHGRFFSVHAEKHSLYYIYTALSKPVDLPGIYEFTAMGLLDDRQIDYYNSEEKRKIPKQHWMKEKMEEDYWEKGTQSRKSKEQWFNVNIHNLMDRMRDNESDPHVFQWRVGCEVEIQGKAVKFLKGVYEISYDGEKFLSFDDKESQWVAPVDAAVPTKRKWDNDPTLNQYTKGYLEKECVDWLNRFREYADEEFRTGTPPDVHVFAKKSISDKSKLKLTCLATGFYPKYVMMKIRKYRRSLPKDEIESTGIRPNHDGSFQMRKSVEIKEDEKADYDCFVTYNSIKEPVVMKWDGKCWDCPTHTVSYLIPAVIGGVIGGLTPLAFVLLIFILNKIRIIDCTTVQNPPNPEDVNAAVPLQAGGSAETSNTRTTESQEDENGHGLIRKKIPGDSSVKEVAETCNM